jgi:hypothetical protein
MKVATAVSQISWPILSAQVESKTHYKKAKHSSWQVLPCVSAGPMSAVSTN